MKPGDRVRATWGENVIVGVLVSRGEEPPGIELDTSFGRCRLSDEWESEVIDQQPHQVPEGVRYFLDADGYGWREIPDDGHGHGVMHSMIPTNPDNSPTPEPYLYLIPAAQVIEDVRALAAPWTCDLELSARLAAKYGVQP